MNDTGEPLKPHKEKGVYIEKIHLRCIIEHFKLLSKTSLQQFKQKILADAHMYFIGNSKIFQNHISDKFHKLKQLKLNFVAVAVLFLLFAVFTHYAIATAASTSPLEVFFSIEDSVGNINTENNDLVYEPINTAYIVNFSAFKLLNIPPQIPQEIIINKIWVSITAYSSTADQTDGNPFVTASGTTVREGIVAANFLPIGAKIRIPEHYGDKVFIVEDRMNSRYWEVVDIWMPTRAEALSFGLRNTYIEVIEEI